MAVRSERILVTDFDGTITRNDFYHLALQQLTPPDMPDYWGMYRAGALTHFGALNKIFSHIHADEAAVLAVVRQMEIDPALPAAVETLRQAGWRVVIASAGCLWYIRYLLGDLLTQVTLHGNPGGYSPECGLVMTAPVDSPFYSPDTGIDKPAVVRDALQSHDVVAFAGDGPPDLPAALLVPPERRFARGWLAAKLTKDGVPFRRFEWWSEIAGEISNWKL